MCHGLPSASRVAETLAEIGAWPVSVTADLRALGHLERLSRAPGAGPMLSYLRELPKSREAAARIHDDLVGKAHLYTDGSVRQDGSAAAACVVPHLDVARQCRLSYRASSTTAELVGLHLAADILEESPFLNRVAILCDSRSALRQLLLDERPPPLAQRIACRLHALQQQGCDLWIQWIPSHVGVAGNEAADDLAKRAHDPLSPLLTRFNSFDVARLHFKQELALRHTDTRVGHGRPPRLLPESGFTRRERAFLLALRTGSVWPAERKHRLRGASSPLCQDCGAVETLQHLMCECSALSTARATLARVYRAQNLPCLTVEDVLHPSGCTSSHGKLFRALLNFADDVGLVDRL
ncbi:uncharacterized protein LOC119440151 [Dermacentor silvarum]|uniref:uncharacterized protein LOC119440151 n=1 Tax=Dermacentor silvarum TaxID=543639 RepID=UPI0018972785|nr:uncharacterized protein LOC119440151 [Dermacentor silvarum]